ncbi:MAG: hypothetical protein QOH81_1969 [Sphingomonadales bacterium]|jgi:hypothetical protein|nr:hypothetical protein [Sphingomonadales bacterium]
MGRHSEHRERQGYDARRPDDGRSGRGNEHHRTILERIEEKLSRLLGSDDEQYRISPEAFVYDEGAGEPRILGGPHASAPGWDPSFAGPRFDRVDVGSVGTHGVHPVSSVYGAGYGVGGAGPSSAREWLALERARPPRGGVDHAYSDWRDRQIAQLDRDYEEYRREHQDKFNREFGDWRDRRQQQRGALARVSPDMEVVGSDGGKLGTVESVRGDSILLASDEAEGARQRAVPCGWIEIVDVAVIVDRSADEARRAWRDQESESALPPPEDARREAARERTGSDARA